MPAGIDADEEALAAGSSISDLRSKMLKMDRNRPFLC